MRRCSCNRCVAAREVAAAKAVESTLPDAPLADGSSSGPVAVKDQATSTDSSPAYHHQANGKRKVIDVDSDSDSESDSDEDPDSDADGDTGT